MAGKIAFYSVLVLIILAASFARGQTPSIPPNVQIPPSNPQIQNEEQVCYHPFDSDILITVFRDFSLGYRRCSISRSTDGGASWNTLMNDLLLYAGAQSDPVLTFDRFGTLYCCFLEGAVGPTNVINFAFIKSTNKGETWLGPYGVTDGLGGIEDKEFIACDRTGGINDGNIYISWTRFPDPVMIMFARSTDGAETFEPAIEVAPPVYSESCDEWLWAGFFSQPLVGADGAVYVFYYASDTYPDTCDYYHEMRISKSIDGGETWP